MPTPNSGIPYVPENTTDPAAGLNLSLNVIDALLTPDVLGLGTTTPPGTPADGDLYVVGPGATGAWSGQDENLARYVSEGDFWQFYQAGVQAKAVLYLGAWYTYYGSSGWVGAGVPSVEADNVAYDNTTSGLSANNVQDAIDEIAGGGGGPGGVQSIVAGSGISVNNTDPSNPIVSATGSSGTGLGWFNVMDYGATGDGVTDDTAAIQAAINAAAAAGGGVVYFPRGIYIVAGALQDTSRSNAQILLPLVDYVDTEQVTIELRGEFPPPTVFSVIGTTPVPVHHSIIKGTLNAGAGGALIGGHGPAGTFGDFTNVHLRVRDLTFRMPSNPVLTALNLSRTAIADLDDVVVDVGSYYVQGYTEPTTATSFGIRMPANNNGALSRLGSVNVAGFYNGYQFAEHCTGYSTQTAWGCKRAFEFASATNHAQIFQRLMAVHCQRAVVATGIAYVQIDQLNMEHAASGWWTPVYDLDDASDLLRGNLRWHIVTANVGVTTSFLRNGGAGMDCKRLGDNSGGGGGVPVVVNSALTTLALFAADAGKYVRFTATGAKTLTVRLDATEPLPANGEWHFRNAAGGDLTVSPVSGVTVNPPAGGTLIVPTDGTVTLKRVALDTFDLIGQTVPV